jgi:polysaccharide biosynthesis PFTS motif protein
MKTIIFCSEPKFLWIFKKFSIYIRSSFSINKNINAIFVRDDIFSAFDFRHCDHLASCIESELIERVISANDVAFLTEWGGKIYAQYFIGDGVIEHARNVYESFNFASKVKSKYNIKGNVYIFPLNFSLRVYKEMEIMGLIPQNIRIHFLVKIYIKIYNIIKFLYFFIRILSYPEIIALKAKNQNNFKKYNYKTCAYLDDGLLGEVSNDNRIFSLFDNKETLYIDDRFRKFQSWPEKTRKIGLNVLRLEDVVKEIGTIDYLKKFYRSAFIWRSRMIGLIIKHTFLVKNCSRATRERILWDIFYSKFSVKNAVRVMVKENLTTSIVHKNNNTKTRFLYFATEGDTLTREVDSNKSNCHDYTHMISSSVIAPKEANDWFRTLENNIEEYVDLGPILSDCISDLSNQKEEIRKQMSIPKNTKVVSFFDGTVGWMGVLTHENYNAILDSIISLSKKNQDVFFIFKSKKNFSHYRDRGYTRIIELIECIRSRPNCMYVNDLNINSFAAIIISDLVISSPMSSIFSESICAGVKAISYDPKKQFKNINTWTLKFEKIRAFDYNELEGLIKHWLSDNVDDEFKQISKEVLCHLDNKCDHSAIERFKSLLD